MSPGITLKIATSLDGKIATASGESRWITGEAAREQVHRIRAEHAAVLVGIETLLSDDPALNVRLDGYQGRQPRPVVADTRARTPLTAKLVAAGGIVVCGAEADPARVEALTGACADVRQSPEKALTAHFIAGELSSLGSTMIEGGGVLAASFLKAGLVDRIYWFRAPIILGGDARGAIGSLAVEALCDAPRYRRIDVRVFGEDILETLER
jgi:diaminohydroxyphosphoribosylaminopyrimidine deaminase / 5-amino-6-(5-phosphoribosylamino)uracil reductase